MHVYKHLSVVTTQSKFHAEFSSLYTTTTKDLTGWATPREHMQINKEV